jgi:D-glycero-alpha-D-manno-heptose-7-phosphate kinase
VSASAPGRIDCGGTWDLVPLALPFASCDPSTVNITLSLRTTVTVSAHDEGRVLVRAPGLPDEDWPLRDAPYSSPLAAYFLLAQHVNVAGIRLTVTSDIPPRSGLGGSAAAIVAATAALTSLTGDESGPSPARVAELAHLVEYALYTCGRQDHLAAAYGGVNLWQWSFGQAGSPYRRRQLTDPDRLEEIGRRLVVVFSGHAHDSAAMTESWIAGFRAGHDRQTWLDANQQTRRLWQALTRGRWADAVDAVERENRLRAAVSPGAWTDRMVEFADVARRYGAAARYAGGGGGGCVWAIGEPAAVAAVRAEWVRTASGREGAFVVDAGLDPRGVVQWKN